MQLSPQLEAWLKARNIDNLDDLQTFMLYSFLGSITNHNVREGYVDLNDEAVSKMLEYYRMSVLGPNDRASYIFDYQKDNYNNWRAYHYEYDEDHDEPNIFGNF